MKKYISVFVAAITLCGNISAQQVQRANVYFQNNSAELTSNVSGLLDTIYSKLPEGKKIRIGLVGDKEDFSMTRYSESRFNNVKDYYLSKNVKPEFINYELTSSGAEAVIEKERKIVPKKFMEIDEYLGKSAQRFFIDPKRDNTIRGDKGTEISFPAYAFECADGSEPSGKIKIELREFYSRGDLLKANLHTMSNGEILETGGTVQVLAFCGDEEAQLAYDQQITLSFPYKEFKNGMQTFNGFEEGGDLNWVLDEGSEQYFDPDINDYDPEGYYLSSKNEQGIDSYLLNSSSLGWINCDRFYDDPREKMEIVLNVDTALHPAVRMVYKDIQSITTGYDDRKGKVTFVGIPHGSEVTIVAYSIVDNKPYMTMKNIIVNSNTEEKLALTETTKKWMERELLSLK